MDEKRKSSASTSTSLEDDRSPDPSKERVASRARRDVFPIATRSRSGCEFPDTSWSTALETAESPSARMPLSQDFWASSMMPDSVAPLRARVAPEVARGLFMTERRCACAPCRNISAACLESCHKCVIIWRLQQSVHTISCFGFNICVVLLLLN